MHALETAYKVQRWITQAGQKISAYYRQGLRRDLPASTYAFYPYHKGYMKTS
jgi:hypothetical protein